MIIPRGPGLRGIFIFRPSSFCNPISYSLSCNTFLPVRIFVISIFVVTFNMQKFNILSLFITLMVLIIIDSCVSHDFPEYTCTNEAVSYALDVDPIVDTKCAITGCHNGDNGAEKNWTDFSLFQSKAESGIVKFRVTNRIMPPADSPAGPLTQEEINTIACWADQGAQNN